MSHKSFVVVLFLLVFVLFLLVFALIGGVFLMINGYLNQKKNIFPSKKTFIVKSSQVMKFQMPLRNKYNY